MNPTFRPAALDVGGAVFYALGITLGEGESLSVDVYPLLENEPAPEGLLLSMEMDGEGTSVDIDEIIAAEQRHNLSFNVVHAFSHLIDGSFCPDKSSHWQE